MAVFDGTSGGATLPSAFFDPRLRDLPQRQLFVRSLIPTTMVTSDKVGYVKQTVFTNAAAAVAAGAVKPQSTITVAREEAPIRVIAHVTEGIDRSLLTDYDQATGIIDNQLRLGVLLEEEDQIINGDGTAPNISGSSTRSACRRRPRAPTRRRTRSRRRSRRSVRLRRARRGRDASERLAEIALLRTADGLYIWGDPRQTTPSRAFGASGSSPRPS